MDTEDYFGLEHEYEDPTGHSEDEEDVNEDREDREKNYDTDNDSTGSYDDENKIIKTDEPEDDEEEEEEEEEEDKKEEPKKKSKVVEPSKRVTVNRMTKYEYSYIVAKRAEMIEHGSPLMIPDTKEIKAIKIAMEETDAGFNPIIIRRTLPNGNIEEWKNSELLPPKNFSFE
jgi:DNA-directed RNA polymerase subunit K/omega